MNTAIGSFKLGSVSGGRYPLSISTFYATVLT